MVFKTEENIPEEQDWLQRTAISSHMSLFNNFRIFEGTLLGTVRSITLVLIKEKYNARNFSTTSCNYKASFYI